MGPIFESVGIFWKKCIFWELLPKMCKFSEISNVINRILNEYFVSKFGTSVQGYMLNILLNFFGIPTNTSQVMIFWKFQILAMRNFLKIFKNFFLRNQCFQFFYKKSNLKKKFGTKKFWKIYLENFLKKIKKIFFAESMFSVFLQEVKFKKKIWYKKILKNLLRKFFKKIFWKN